MLLNVNRSIEGNFHESTKIRFGSEMRIRQTRAVAIEEVGVQNFGVWRVRVRDVSPETTRLYNETRREIYEWRTRETDVIINY